MQATETISYGFFERGFMVRSSSGWVSFALPPSPYYKLPMEDPLKAAHDMAAEHHKPKFLPTSAGYLRAATLTNGGEFTIDHASHSKA